MRGYKTEREYLLLNLYSCYLLPAYTLLFAGYEEWFRTNFSVLAVSGSKYYRSFLIWAVVTAIYFGVLLILLTEYLSARCRWRVLTLLGAALVSLTIGVPLPYLPDRYPELSKLHIFLCFTTGVWMMAALLMIILGQRRRNRDRYAPILRQWWYIVLGSGILFLVSGMVSSAMEIYFVLSAALLCRRLYQLQEEETA